jgi:beta-lactam-binding protein with PASTA domain
MKLGSSIRRRRRKEWKGFSFKRILPGKLLTFLGKGRGRLASLADPRTLWMLGLLAVFGFAGGFLLSTRVVYPLPPPPGDLSTIPNLAGESLDDAADSLAAMGLILGAIDSLNHPTIPAGRIVGQSPLPGQLSLVGDTVRIAQSIGPEQRPVPDVLRLHADWARTILETSGFVVLVDSVESENPRGGVVSMTPEPGTEATVPMDVYLSVSMGPPEFEMPLLLGVSEDEALFLLDSLGLVVGEVETRFRFGRDQGLVVEQEPPPATMVQKGDAVRLVVGRRGQ